MPDKTTVVDIRYDSFEDLFAGALVNLGDGVVKLAVLEPHQQTIIRDAVRWFVRWRGQSKGYKADFINGISSYALPDDCMFVYDVILPQPRFDLPFPDLYEYPEVFYWQKYPAQYSFVLQLIQRRALGKRILSHEADWEFVKEADGPKLKITPTSMYIDASTGPFLVMYKSSQLNIRMMDATDLDLLSRRMKAQLKMIEGRILSKYGSWPGAVGEITTDGETLRQEAQAEMESLDEQVKELNWPIPMVMG